MKRLTLPRLTYLLAFLFIFLLTAFRNCEGAVTTSIEVPDHNKPDTIITAELESHEDGKYILTIDSSLIEGKGPGLARLIAMDTGDDLYFIVRFNECEKPAQDHVYEYYDRPKGIVRSQTDQGCCAISRGKYLKDLGMMKEDHPIFVISEMVGPPLGLSYHAQHDLDGDGELDTIDLELSDYDKCYLTINDQGVRQTSEIEPWDGFSIVDLDKGDPYKEIIIHEFGPNIIHNQAVFKYDGRWIYKLGDFSGTVILPGNGELWEINWIGFWPSIDKYVLRKNGKEMLWSKQPLYYVGVQAEVMATFPVYSERKGDQELIQVLKGEKVEILLCYKDRSSWNSWYMVRTEKDLLGWVDEDTLYQKTNIPRGD